MMFKEAFCGFHCSVEHSVKKGYQFKNISFTSLNQMKEITISYSMQSLLSYKICSKIISSMWLIIGFYYLTDQTFEKPCYYHKILVICNLVRLSMDEMTSNYFWSLNINGQNENNNYLVKNSISGYILLELCLSFGP